MSNMLISTRVLCTDERVLSFMSSPDFLKFFDCSDGALHKYIRICGCGGSMEIH